MRQLRATRCQTVARLDGRPILILAFGYGFLKLRTEVLAREIATSLQGHHRGRAMSRRSLGPARGHQAAWVLPQCLRIPTWARAGPTYRPQELHRIARHCPSRGSIPARMNLSASNMCHLIQRGKCHLEPTARQRSLIKLDDVAAPAREASSDRLRARSDGTENTGARRAAIAAVEADHHQGQRYAGEPPFKTRVQR
jgi:hypothetical protein